MNARNRTVSRRFAAASFALAMSAALPAWSAFTVTGTVRNEAGAGLSNVDLDFIDTCTGDSAFLVNDKTAADGSFSIVVNAGAYDIHFTPPAGSVVAGAELDEVTVGANLALGITTLHPGRLVSGAVRNVSAAGIAGVDLKFVDTSTGRKVYFSKDVTPSGGTYSVRVVPGTYDVEYRPPVGTTYVTVRRSNLVVGASDISGLVDTLPTGFKVNGNVRDAANSSAKNVDLNFYDACTGEKIATANDNTDAQGNYAVYVPAGTYSIHFNPPRCRSLSSERVTDQVIDRNRGVGNVGLQTAVLVSGRVLDDLGQPIASAKIKFYVAGARQAATRDDTDALGNFSILVPLGTYAINVEPPVSRDLLVGRLDPVSVLGPTALGDIQLEPGTPLSGLALAPGGSGARNVNLNVVDSVTRASVRIAHDSSNADGSFRVVVPPGTYDVQYDPPLCSGLAPAEQKSLSAGSPLTLPVMHLVAGIHLTGAVVDSLGLPVAGTDLDLFPAGTRDKIYTPRDTTDASGLYDVLVAPGTFDVDYTPPAGLPLRPARRFGVAAAGSVALPNTVLPNGFRVSGFVRASGSLVPVSGARLDFFAPGSSTALFTPHNGTAVDGSYSVTVDAGTWDILYTPPTGGGLAPRWLRGQAVAADLVLPDTLLLPITVPAVASVTPATGSTTGGQVITITGSGFQPDATVQIDGVPTTVVSVPTSNSLIAVTPAHPAGPAGIAVTNPASAPATLLAGFTYVEPASPIQLRVARSGSNVVLSWTATGQPSYTVFRSASPASFNGSLLGSTTSTGFTDSGAASSAGISFYVVD